MTGDPGKLLTLFREQMGVGIMTFAESCNWSYSTQYRLETGKTPFKRWHLEALVAAEWLEVGDEWYRRFEQAIANRSENIYMFTGAELHSFVDHAVDIALENLQREDQVPGASVSRRRKIV